MNVKALVDFHDNLRDVDRKAGEEFVVTRERYEEINAIGAEKIGAPIVEEVVRTAEAKGVQTPEKRAKRARRPRKAD
jgi:hypothetical protein